MARQDAATALELLSNDRGEFLMATLDERELSDLENILIDLLDCGWESGINYTKVENKDSDVKMKYWNTLDIEWVGLVDKAVATIKKIYKSSEENISV